MKIIFYLILGLLLMWLGGLGHFIYSLTEIPSPGAEKTDGIVVLTGGRDRLLEAGQLLEAGLADKLFVSGVNSKVTEDELRIALGVSPELGACCVESGVQAQDTVGNAREIAAWVDSGALSSIRVVTSLEHMPRALVELRRELPEITIVRHPVGRWRPENIRFVSLVREYSKYVVSLSRYWILDILVEDPYMQADVNAGPTL